MVGVARMLSKVTEIHVQSLKPEGLKRKSQASEAAE